MADARIPERLAHADSRLDLGRGCVEVVCGQDDLAKPGKGHGGNLTECPFCHRKLLNQRRGSRCRGDRGASLDLVSPRSSAAALGVGACAVLAAGIIAAIVRGPDSTHSTSAVFRTGILVQPSASPPSVTVRSAAQHAAPPTTPKRHYKAPTA